MKRSLAKNTGTRQPHDKRCFVTWILSGLIVSAVGKCRCTQRGYKFACRVGSQLSPLSRTHSIFFSALEEKCSATSPSIVASPRRACPTFTGSTEGRCTRHLWLQLVCLVEPLSILPFHAHTGFPLEPFFLQGCFCASKIGEN